MKKKIHSLKEYYKAHPKRFWFGGILLIIILAVLFGHKPANTVTAIDIKHTDLKQTVLATGQVTSETDLDLSFSASGLITALPAVVGSKVYKGQVLATLENRSEYAALKSAQANYQKVIEGSSNEEVAVSQAALDAAKSDLDNTKKVQDTLVDNAYRALLNTGLSPIASSGTSTTAPTVSGTYTGMAEGSYVITVYTPGNGGSLTYRGLESGNGKISTTTPAPLGTLGLFIQFPSNSSVANDEWTVLLPNTKSATYLNDYNAYQNALKNHDSAIANAQVAVTKAEADLALKKAAARPADVGVAQAQVDEAQAAYQKTVLTAPANGTIVHVDTKIGERADAQKEIMVLQDVGNLYVEANINETSIAKVVLGQPVRMTLDAFGPNTDFTGEVIHIDPSSTTESGVVNYIIKTSIADPSGKNQIRPGMNANMTITAWDHQNVIAVPKAAVTANADGTQTVKVISDEKKKKYETRAVTLGDQGDGNLVEITSGLSDGEKIAIVTK